MTETTGPGDEKALRVVLLPQSHPDPATWSALVAEQRAFRLFSLLSAPEAFSSTFAREAAFDGSVWEDRMRNPDAHTFVAVSEDAASADQGRGKGPAEGIQDDLVLSLAGEWVGTTVLMGPKAESFVRVTESPWQTMGAESSNGNRAPSNMSVSYYHMNAVFTHPDFRRRGIARSLIEAALAFARRKCAEERVDTVRCTILVEQANKAATKLYQQAGFSKIAEEVTRSPRKERADGTTIPEHDIKVYTMEKWMTAHAIT